MESNFFYKLNDDNKKLSLIINGKIDLFIKEFSQNYIFSKYIKSFGIIGPCARGEGFYIDNDIRSDIDLYLVTNFISLKLAKKIHKLFNSFFENKLDVSLLLFSPNSFKKPDLMIYELTNSGRLLYGKKLEIINIKNISRLETVRNLVYRGFYFLDNFHIDSGKIVLNKNIDNETFLYSFSKVVFALGEVFLLLNRTYVASNIKRNDLIKNNIYSNKLKGFNELHEKMHLFRYENTVPKDFNIDEYIIIGYKLLLEGYKIIFKELYGYNTFNFDKFGKIKAKGISFFANRILYTLYSFLKFKEVKILLFKEPFIDFTEKYIYFLEKAVKGEVLYEDELKLLIQDWKTAPWLYYYI